MKRDRHRLDKEVKKHVFKCNYSKGFIIKIGL